MSSFVRFGGAALAAAALGTMGLVGPAAACDKNKDGIPDASQSAQPSQSARPDKTDKPVEKSGSDKPSETGPAGNNGTVKIIGAGDIDRIPENNPHVGCAFGVEWYGFDKGTDVVSHVTFALHAPTAKGKLTVDGPSDVPVGGDAAGGGTDLDGRQIYKLAATGLPHPKQGFHVKVTVSTPRANGNDTKTKVFWFKGCDVAAQDTIARTDATPEASTAPAVEQSSAASPSSAQSDAAVPTSIDAGLAGSKAADSSPIPALWPIVALVAAAGAIGGLLVAMRRRAARG